MPSRSTSPTAARSPRAGRRLRPAARRVDAVVCAALLNGLDDSVLAVDADWRVFFANPLAAARLGRAEKALRGQDFFSLWPAGQDPEAGRQLREVMRTRTAREFEVHERTDGGGERWAQVHAQPLDNGGLLVVSWDTTARRAAEEALRLSEARYRSLVHATAGVVWLAAPDGAIRGELAGWEDLTGQTPARFRGWGWLEAVHPEDRARVEATWRQALRTREPVQMEYAVRARDGSLRHLLVRGAPIFEDDLAGTVREWVGTCRDVTETRRAEAERQERERHAHLLAEAGSLLAGSLDYPTTLRNVAELAVREIANFCLFDVLDRDGDGGLHRVAWACRDPAWQAQNPAIARLVPPPDAVRHPIRRVLRTGRSEFLPHLDAVARRALVFSPEHGRLMRRFKPSALMFVPVTSRDGIIGVLTLAQVGVSTFTVAGLALAEELGRRAGAALDLARVHDALRRSEGQFRGLVGAIPQMVWTNTPEGRVDFVNERWVDYSALDAEASGREEGWRNLIHPDDLPGLLACWHDSLRTGEPFEYEARMRRAHDGAFRWHLNRAVPLRDGGAGGAGPGARTPRWFGTCTDVHDLRQAEHARREADRRRGETLALLDSLLANAPIGFAFFDREHRIVRVNRVLADINGRPVEAHLGRPVREVAPVIAAAVEPVVDRVFNTGQPVLDLEITGETPAGPGVRRTWINGFYPVPGPGRGAVEWVGVVVLEITRQKQLEDELQGRAAALAAADRRKDEFLAMLAHELRNPLAAAATGLELLRPAAPAADRAWAAEVIARQVQHLTRLIDDLLDVSRITQDKIPLRRVPLEVPTLVRETVECARAALAQREHQLTVTLDPTLPTLDADPTRVEQILVNLLTNAARYTPPGGRVTLSARAEDGAVVFRVRDNGVGIPAGQLDAIFELFAQGDRSLARSEGGLGLGLTIVKKLAELHGGSARAASGGPGRGSEFTVRLPTAARPEETIPRPEETIPRAEGVAPRAEGVTLRGEGVTSGGKEAAPEAEGAAPGGKAVAPGQSEAAPARRLVLVVDDNADTTGAMSRLLRMRGFETLVAHGGLEALEVARTERPTVILLDIGLPDLDGYQVAVRLRAQEAAGERPRALLAAISGYGQEEDRRRSRDAGFDHHLVKPVDFPALLELVRQAP